MALTAKQRSKLPASAFAYPSTKKYPVPTKTPGPEGGDLGDATVEPASQRAEPRGAEEHGRQLRHGREEGREPVRREGQTVAG